MYRLIVSPSREALHEYRDLKESIDERVNQINIEFGSLGYAPIDYEYRNMEFDELTSWYIRADVMLVSPLIDGMNLVAKEYIATKPKNDGVLILSKNAGAAYQMKEALLVDPTNISKIADAIREATSMSAEERSRRHKLLREKVRTEDALQWAQDFRDSLQS